MGDGTADESQGQARRKPQVLSRGDDGLKREGKVDQATGHGEGQGRRRVSDKVKDAVNRK